MAFSAHSLHAKCGGIQNVAAAQLFINNGLERIDLPNRSGCGRGADAFAAFRPRADGDRFPTDNKAHHTDPDAGQRAAAEDGKSHRNRRTPVRQSAERAHQQRGGGFMPVVLPPVPAATSLLTQMIVAFEGP